MHLKLKSNTIIPHNRITNSVYRIRYLFFRVFLYISIARFLVLPIYSSSLAARTKHIASAAYGVNWLCPKRLYANNSLATTLARICLSVGRIVFYWARANTNTTVAVILDAHFVGGNEKCFFSIMNSHRAHLHLISMQVW